MQSCSPSAFSLAASALLSLVAFGCVADPSGAEDVTAGAAALDESPSPSPSPSGSPTCFAPAPGCLGCSASCFEPSGTYTPPMSSSTACRAMTQAQVDAGEAALTASYQRIWADLECEGVPHYGTGDQPSCVNVSNAVFAQIIGSIPPGFGCARRQHAVPGETGGRDHWVVECYTLPLVTPARHFVFDYWKDGSGPLKRAPDATYSEYGPITAQQATWTNCNGSAGPSLTVDASAQYPTRPYIYAFAPTLVVLAQPSTPGIVRAYVSQVDKYGIEFVSGRAWSGANVEIERIATPTRAGGVVNTVPMTRVAGAPDASGRSPITWNVTLFGAQTPARYNVYIPNCLGIKRKRSLEVVYQPRLATVTTSIGLGDPRWQTGVPIRVAYQQSFENDLPTVYANGRAVTATLGELVYGSHYRYLDVIIPPSLRALGPITITTSNRVGTSAPITVTVFSQTPSILSYSPSRVPALTPSSVALTMMNVVPGEPLTAIVRTSAGESSVPVTAVGNVVNVALPGSASQISVFIRNAFNLTSNPAYIEVQFPDVSCTCAPTSGIYRDACTTEGPFFGSYTCRPSYRGNGWCTCNGAPW